MAENTIIHEINLAGYKATSTGGMLDLGTWGSYGIEKLHLTLDAAWQNLTITAFFNVKGKVVAKKVVGKDGYADVPWEATKESTFAGRIVFEGSINGQRRITTDLNYKVSNHSEITDIDPVPTDDRWNQFVTENKEYRDGAFEAAEKANARAEDAEAASDDAQAAARAAKASEAVAKESKNAAAASENNARISAGAAAVSEGNAVASAEKAMASENAAAESASKAAASKKASTVSAAAAAGSAAQAETQKAAAAKSARDAQGYMQTASSAATDANTSAENAAESKAAAASSATAAAGSATAAAGNAKTASDAAAVATDAKAAAVASQKDAAASKAAAANSAIAAKTSEDAAAKSAADADSTANSIKESMTQIAANKEAVSQLKEDTTVLQKRQKMLVGSETGNPVSCDDAFATPLFGLTVYGKSTQDGTPSPDNPVPIVSAGDGGTVVVKVSDGNGKEQTLTLQTPTGLPGIPVASNGNYTDQNGQQWVCDEVDLERGVKVQRVKVLDINDTSLRLYHSSNSYWYVSTFLLDCSLNNTGTKSYKEVMCQKFPVVSQLDETKYSYPIVAPYGHVDRVELRFRAPEALYATIEDFRQTIVGTKVYYPLATPVETPLTPAEIAAYKALTAYAPDTVVQASDGAGVKLEYQRDVNIAIKNLKEEIGEKLDNFYISNAHVIKRTSTGSIGSHYLIKYSVNFDDYQIMKFVVPSTGKTYKIEFANSQSEVLKTVDTSGFVYGSEVLLSIPLTTSEIIVEVAYEVGVNLEITLYKKININAEDVAGAMQTSVYTNYNNLLRAENITDNVEIQQYAEVINDQYVSAYIPVVNGETIYCNYSLGTPVAWLCGEDKKRITSVTLPLSNNQVSRNVGYTIVTENAKWIRLSWKKDRQGIEGALFFSNKPIRFIENDVVIKKEYVPELNTGRLNNWWYMKNGDSLGDSLTGQGYFQSWTRRFFGLNDFKNHGVGGSKLSGEDIDSTRPSMWKDVRIDALSTTADFVTVLGGQNDGNVEIGDITKTNYDTNTYVGALNTIIDKIYNHCKDGVIIILCTPFYVPAEGDGERFVLLDEAVRGVAKLHGLPVADFGGLSTADKNTANVYWGDDKTHPTEKFYKDKIAPILINAMEQINPINWDDVNYYTES